MKKNIKTIYIIAIFFMSIFLVMPVDNVIATSWGIFLDLEVDSYHIPIDITSNSITRSYNHTVRVNQSDYYASVAGGNETPYTNGWLKTFKVNESDGQIDTVFVDEYYYDIMGYGCTINQIAGTDVYVCLTSNEPTGATWNATAIRTFHISDTDGSISFIAEQNASIDISEGWYFKEMVHFGEVYFLVGTTGSNSLRLQTYRVYDTGTINSTRLDKVSNGINSKGQCVIKIDSDTAAIAFTDTYSNDGYISTYDISSNGIITLKDTWEFDTIDGRYPTIFHIYDDIYGIAYSGQYSACWLKTLTISDSGIITKSFIDDLEVTLGTGYTTTGYTRVTTINNVGDLASNIGIYAIIFKDVTSGNGMIGTIYINQYGTIGDELVNELDIWESTAITDRPVMLYMGNDYYLFSYDRTDYDHYLRTVEITTYDGPEDVYISLNVYNESNETEGLTFNVFVTNQSGSETYYVEDCTNPTNITFNLIPTGNDISFIISSDGYYNRQFSMDIDTSIFYEINVYLSPITNDSHLYFINVINEYNEPIDDVYVVIEKYINSTGEYEHISSLYTDGAGQCSAYLISGINYKVYLNRTGYQSRVEDYIPDPVYYGIYYPKYFKMYSENYTPIPEYNNRSIAFDVTMLGNSSLFIEHNASICGNNTVEIYIYEHLNYTTSLNGSYDYTTCNNSFYHSPINTSRMYTVYFYQNFTDTLDGNYYYVRTVMPLTNYTYNKTYIETEIEDVYGPWEMGYVNMFLLFLPFVIIVCLVGYAEKGLGAMAGGLYLAFANSRIEGLGLIKIY